MIIVGKSAPEFPFIFFVNIVATVLVTLPDLISLLLRLLAALLMHPFVELLCSLRLRFFLPF